jgi:hypothetical protein
MANAPAVKVVQMVQTVKKAWPCLQRSGGIFSIRFGPRDWVRFTVFISVFGFNCSTIQRFNPLFSHAANHFDIDNARELFSR